MDYRRIRKNISYLFARAGLSFCSLITKVIPGKFLYSFASAIGGIGYRFVNKQKKIASESLRIAFGQEKSQNELEAIARDSFIYMAKSAVELMFLMDRQNLLKKRVEFANKENLDSALSQGNGVILVSAHFGNFPLLMAKLSLEGYRVSGIMRPMRDSQVEKMFLERRNRLGVKTIYSQPRNICVSKTIESLRNNEIVFIPIDQNFGTGGIFVDFFGRKAATATGPVVLAQRTKAALVPCFIIRQKNDSHKLIFEEPIKLKETGDPQETVRVNIQELTNIIEDYIRRFPAEWGWIHRRWKTKPN